MEFVGVASYLVYDAADRTWTRNIKGGIDWTTKIDLATRYNRVQAEKILPKCVDGVVILAPEHTPVRSHFHYDDDRQQIVMRTDWMPRTAIQTDPETSEETDEEESNANV